MAEQEFEGYLKDMFIFQGKMNAMANSIELILEVIFEKIGIAPIKMLGSKISKFEKCKPTLVGKYTGNFDGLVSKLEKFNEDWKIMKHGMIVGGQQDLTIHKNNKFHKFDKKKQVEIEQEFTQIMEGLIEISRESDPPSEIVKEEQPSFNTNHS